MKRRHFVQTGLALWAGSRAGMLLAATPDCRDDPTRPQTAGPFHLPDSPLRQSLLEPGLAGSPMLLQGRVLDTDCRPITDALLDFWQADDDGVYDRRGYRLRGHQFSDGEGSYRLETIVPGLYPGRTRHIHVILQAPGYRSLTTQLYFPREPWNERDRLYRDELLIDWHGEAEPAQAGFDFVLIEAG